MRSLNRDRVLLRTPLTSYRAMAHPSCPPDVERFIHEALAKRKPSLMHFATISRSVAEMAKYLKRHCNASHATLYFYVWAVQQYCKWCTADPDQLINERFTDEGLPNQKALLLEARRLDDYIGAFQSEGYSPGHITNCVKAVKTFFRINGLRLEPPLQAQKIHDKQG